VKRTVVSACYTAMTGKATRINTDTCMLFEAASDEKRMWLLGRIYLTGF